ncbi:MAG: hypothetical protein ACREFF_04595 [Candidatus Udaeobacter sp.]
MNASSIIWLASPLVAYLALVVVGVVWLRGTRARQLRLNDPLAHRVLFAAYLALVFTPGMVTDFFLFGFWGPALLGCFFLIPGTLVHMFSDPSILPFTLRATALYHLLPIAAGFFIAYFLLWAISRLRRRAANQHV